MGRWRRWSLDGIPTVLQKLNLSIPQFLCSFPRFVIPFSHHMQGISKSPESFVNDVLHCPLSKSCSSWIYQGFQCPSRLADLTLYSMLPFPIKNRRNRYPVWSPLSNVRRLDSSLSTEMLLPVSATFIRAVSTTEASVPNQADCFGPFS